MIVRGASPNREGIAHLAPPGSIGVELGVATGQFSKRLLNTGQFNILYSIDAWAGGSHDLSEMKQAQQALDPFGERSVIIRARFDEAVSLFEEEFFDFIYIDGFAHTGQEEGQTLRQWWPKLKPGGLFAGDDYSPSWPLTVKAVDEFAAGRTVGVFESKCLHSVWDQSPSWYLYK